MAAACRRRRQQGCLSALEAVAVPTTTAGTEAAAVAAEAEGRAEAAAAGRRATCSATPWGASPLAAEEEAAAWGPAGT